MPFKVLGLLLAIGLASLTLASCTAEENTVATPVPTRAAASAIAPTLPVANEAAISEPLKLVVLIAETQGHISAAADNAAAGHWDLARAHALGHVVVNWDSMKSRLGAPQASEISPAIEALKQAVEREGEAASLAAAANSALERAIGMAGRDSGDAFVAMIVRELVEIAEHEYEEAAGGGLPAEIVEYQDARAFISVAFALYGGISASARAASPHAADEIEHEFAELIEYLEPLAPDVLLVPLAKIEDAVGEIRAELTVIFGLGTDEAVELGERVTQVRTLVDLAIAVYERGETIEAYEHAAEAYLEGFEYLEPALLSGGHRDLVADMELKLKDLRDGIKTGMPAADLNLLRQAIEKSLDQVANVIDHQ